MATARWERIKGILRDAIERSPDARDAFLADACGGDDALRHEVEALLRADEDPGDFLVPPDRGCVSEAAGAVAETGVPRLGPYSLVREIASGGMGTVWLARRADEQFEKTVAVKLIKRGMDSEEILQRFRTERQTLANLEHPFIARLLDGGMADDGRPYLVMEHVEGDPIDCFCDRQALSIPERIRLFQKVCQAVHYAHKNLVVHRDLKPGNILVTSDSTPKLLDFGIAKLLTSAEGGDASVARTADPMRLMTPSYASPEQVLGHPVTTATDVYSLGVVLYEILSGHRPYRFETTTARELERKICEEEPPRPSTIVMRTAERLDDEGKVLERITPESVSRARQARPERLRRRLAGDLDNIVAMAMRKEPERRYASVEQLAEDLGRHLEGRPVLARKDTLAYRMRTFVRRNRAGVAAAVLVAASLVAGIVATSIQARNAERARDEAEGQTKRAIAAENDAQVRAETAEEVLGLFVDVFRLSDPRESPGKAEKTAGAILEDAANRIRVRLAKQPIVRAYLMASIGDVYRNLKNFEKSAPLLEEALRIQLAELGEDHVDTARTRDELGNLFREMGRYEEAEVELRKALEARLRILAPDDPDIALSENNLGLVLTRMGRLDEAQEWLEKALALRKRIYGERHRMVAYTLANLGSVRYRRGDPQGAVKLWRESLAMREEVLAPDHLDIAQNLVNLGVALRAVGNDTEAESLYRRALEIHLRQLPEKHKDVAQNMILLGAVLRDTGRLSEARDLFERAISIQREVLSPDHPDVGMSLNNLGDLLLEEGNPEQARDRFDEALGILRRAFPGDHRNVAYTLSNLARAQWGTGDGEAAARSYREAQEMYARLLGETHPYALLMEDRLAAVLVELGRYEEAEGHLRHLLEAVRKGATFGGIGREELRRRLADLYERWGRPEDAAGIREDAGDGTGQGTDGE